MTWGRKQRLMAASAVALSLTLAACGRSATSTNSTVGNVSPTKGLVTTTPAGTKPYGTVVWAVYRSVNSLDPIYAFDYPENTAISLMCESLLKQAPNGALVPGLASMTNPSPTKLVFTIQPGAKFWDGHPVTPADVIYSLGRQMNPKLGGFYGLVFNRVSSITQTGANQVTINLKQPDYWLPGELASMGGVIIEKAYAQKQGKNYGTPAGGIMCTGAYEFKSWNPGTGVVAVANPHYWGGKTPLAKEIIVKGVPDTTTLTSGLLTGAVQGGYLDGIATLPQLEAAKNAVTIYQGPGEDTDAFIVSNLKGVLGNVKVRQALSLALNRQAIIANVYKGAALVLQPGHLRVRQVGVHQGLRRRAGDGPEPGRGPQAGEGGRGGRQDHHHRHFQPDLQHLRGNRRLPAGRPGDRTEDRP